MAELYSDLSLNFIANPNSGEVRPLTGERSVKQALQNLLRTPIGTRPYNPKYGTLIYDYIFSLQDAETERLMIKDIEYAIKRFEPRVDLTAIEVNMLEYGIDIKIEYYVKGINTPQEINTVINRA